MVVESVEITFVSLFSYRYFGKLGECLRYQKASLTISVVELVETTISISLFSLPFKATCEKTAGGFIVKNIISIITGNRKHFKPWWVKPAAGGGRLCLFHLLNMYGRLRIALPC